MYSVGAPHTWPQALGALMWLIDNVKVGNKSHDCRQCKYYMLHDDFN